MDTTTIYFILSLSAGVLVGYYFYKFFIGGWTNREVDDFVYWIVNHKSPKDLSVFDLTEILELYREDSKVSRRIRTIQKKKARKNVAQRARGLFSPKQDTTG